MLRVCKPEPHGLHVYVCLAQGLHTKVVEQQPQPLTVQLLARIPELSADSAQQLLQLFATAGVTDPKGLLVEDPRHAGWHAVVQNSGIQGAATWPTQLGMLCLTEKLS
jgi:hypothetical protein